MRRNVVNWDWNITRVDTFGLWTSLSPCHLYLLIFYSKYFAINIFNCYVRRRPPWIEPVDSYHSLIHLNYHKVSSDPEMRPMIMISLNSAKTDLHEGQTRFFVLFLVRSELCQRSACFPGTNECVLWLGPVSGDLWVMALTMARQWRVVTSPAQMGVTRHWLLGAGGRRIVQPWSSVGVRIGNGKVRT